jgi:AraC-like DNA-binding protein
MDLLQFSTDNHETIAMQLGFNDAVAFSHAFKVWQGCAPREWQLQLK